MKSPKTLTTTIAALALSAMLVAACSSPESTESTEQQSSPQNVAPLASTLPAEPTQQLQVDQTPTDPNASTSTGQASTTTVPPATQPSTGDTPVERTSLETATPPPLPATTTPTTHQQQGGSVVMSAPTPTPTPQPTPTNTPLPPETPYWQRFTNADYDAFRPPTGSINWTDHQHCAFPIGRAIYVDATPEGISDRLQWPYNFDAEAPLELAIESMKELHPSFFAHNAKIGRWIELFCIQMEALSPTVPVVRMTAEFDAIPEERRWTDSAGVERQIWRSYRIEVRYIFTDGDTYPEYRQLGPMLIEKIRNPCDRAHAIYSFYPDDDRCMSPHQ